MPADYPLRFESLFRRYLWGGRRLQSVLGKQIGAGEDYTESWEIVDHGADQSIVTAGTLARKMLHELVMQHGEDLCGCHHPQPRFPLLLKFLDAHLGLSVQVHPNDEQARHLDPPDLGKTEAWVVLHAEPGSLIFVGLKRGFTPMTVKVYLARVALPQIPCSWKYRKGPVVNELCRFKAPRASVDGVTCRRG